VNAVPDSRIQRHPAPAIPGISDSVRVTAGDMLYVSGAVGFEPDGAVPEDFARAVELTFRELGRALTAGGATFSQVVRLNVYISDLDMARFQTYREVRDTFIDPDHLPASTLVGVAYLFRGAPIEIDAIAAVDR